MLPEFVNCEDGLAICGDGTDPELILEIVNRIGSIPLIIADPPYGNIVKEVWDRVGKDDGAFSDWMISWTEAWSLALLPGGAMYVWGGIGKPNFRPFFKYLTKVERYLTLSTLVTWSKKRAYGTAHNYLFTREECAYLLKGEKPRTFNIPLLEAKRSYAGYDPDYPAKSEHYRRTNVWTDVTEIMRGKIHVAQKPQRVIEIPIEVHTSAGEWVVDPFSGSGTTALAARALGRKWVTIEKDRSTFLSALENYHAKA